jgi:hypothetical protein
MNLPRPLPRPFYASPTLKPLSQKLKRHMGLVIHPAHVGKLGEKAPSVIHAVLPKLTALAILFTPLDGLFKLPSILAGALFYYKFRPGLVPEQLGLLKQGTHQLMSLCNFTLTPFLALGTLALSRTRWAARMLAKPLQYLEWRGAKHYIRTGEKPWGFFPTTSVLRYRAITQHSPAVGGVAGGMVGFQLGKPWANRVTSLTERMTRHALTTTTGGVSGYALGYWVKHTMLTQLKKLKF